MDQRSSPGTSKEALGGQEGTDLEGRGLGTANSTNSSPCQAPFFPCRSHHARWHSCLPNAQTAEEGKLAHPGSHEIHGIPQPHIFLSPHAPVDFDTWPHTSTEGTIPATKTQAWPCLPL